MASEAGGIKLIVGLGNPGAEYANSRHNAGFMVIEKLLAEFPTGRFTMSHTAQSNVYTGKYRGKTLVLQMPLTYMNASGDAVAPLSRRLGISAGEILVISDDLDLAPGRLRLRQGGSDGGHNGLKSIIAKLGSSGFKRLRVGIGRPEAGATADYVLSGFEGDEEKSFTMAISRAAEAVKTVLGAGMTAAMNKFNAAENSDTGIK
ncbi:MAG: aminoacyl-tRNA hydrolase [Lentisphaerae bacterium]|nr:aminoacyl-tRNA hydrolase [Lentisphaerota bacterium]